MIHEPRQSQPSPAEPGHRHRPTRTAERQRARGRQCVSVQRETGTEQIQLDLATGACGYNRPCAHQYVGKSQSCMVENGRLIPHASYRPAWIGLRFSMATGNCSLCRMSWNSSESSTGMRASTTTTRLRHQVRRRPRRFRVSGYWTGARIWIWARWRLYQRTATLRGDFSPRRWTKGSRR